MNIYYHTLVLEYDSHVVVKELLELLVAEVDAELLKPNVINFIINGHFDADLLKPVERENLKAGDVKDADEYSFFLRGEVVWVLKISKWLPWCRPPKSRYTAQPSS